MDIQAIKAFAEVNFFRADSEFQFTIPVNGCNMSTPWIDRTERFELSDEQAVKEWGLQTVLEYCSKIGDFLDGLTEEDIGRILTQAVENKAERHSVTLRFQGKTNYVPCINTAHFKSPKYGEFTIDRERTEWTCGDQARAAYDINMEWIGCYLWSDEGPSFCLPSDLFKDATLVDFEIEDDAPQDYFFDVKSINVAENTYVYAGGHNIRIEKLEAARKKVAECKSQLRDLLDDPDAYELSFEYGASVCNAAHYLIKALDEFGL